MMRPFSFSLMWRAHQACKRKQAAVNTTKPAPVKRSNTTGTYHICMYMQSFEWPDFICVEICVGMRARVCLSLSLSLSEYAR